MTNKLRAAWFFVLMFAASSFIGMYEIGKLKSEAKDLRATTKGAVEKSEAYEELLDADVAVLEEVGDRLIKCEEQLEIMNSIYETDPQRKLADCKADLEFVEAEWNTCVGEIGKPRPTVGR